MNETTTHSGSIRTRRVPKGGKRLESTMVGLTLPSSSMEKIQSYYLATSILLYPENVSFTDFYIMALNSTRHFKESYVGYNYQEKTVFLPLRLPKALKESLCKHNGWEEKKFGEFVRARFIACNRLEEGYRVLTYVWMVKLMTVIFGEEITSIERNKVLYEDYFPGPLELYSSLYELFEPNFLLHPYRFDEPIIRKTCEILNAYKDERRATQQISPRTKSTVYEEQRLQDILAVFTNFLLTFPLLLGDPAVMYQPNISDVGGRLWQKSQEWGGEALASISQMYVSSLSANGFKGIRWNDPLLREIHQNIRDILNSIINEKKLILGQKLQDK